MTEGGAGHRLDVSFLINKLVYPRPGPSGEADFSSADSGRLEEHLVMETAGEKQPRTLAGNNDMLRNINTRGFADKAFNHTLFDCWIDAAKAILGNLL